MKFAYFQFEFILFKNYTEHHNVKIISYLLIILFSKIMFMKSINSLSKSIIWDMRNYLLPVTLAIPAAIVAGSLGKYIYQNCSLLSKRVQESTAQLTQRGENGVDDRVKFLCKSLLACLISVYGASPFLFCPPTLAAPLSTTSICLLSDAAVNGKSYWDTAKKQVQGTKDWARDAYVPREGEVAQDAARRIGQNIALTALGIAIATGALWGVYSLIQHASSQNVGLWDAYRLLPNQTPTTVFLEYAFLGVLHGLLVLKNGVLKDKEATSFHLVQAVISLIFPLFYLCNATTAEPMRLHHSFIGIALALLPFNSLKAFGTTISLDSALYFLSPWRGHGTESYDFMNFFLEHCSTYVSTLSGLCGVEYAIDRILPKEEKDRENQEEMATLENGSYTKKSSAESHQFVTLQEPVSINY